MMEESKNEEMVEQLAGIKEQLTLQNRRARLIWRIVGIVLIAILIFNILLVLLNAVAYTAYTAQPSVTVEEIVTEP